MQHLRSEEEIIATWRGDKSKPLVTICCITYNHEQYIEQTLNGFIGQITDFPIEIIVHDDASADRTPFLIKEYEKKYPKIIKCICQHKNQYQVGGDPFAKFVFPIASGKYFAICEGDDYWTNPEKIAIQFAALERNENIDLCFHYAKIINRDKFTGRVIGRYRQTNGLVPFKDIVQKKHGQIPTASTFIRRSAALRFMEFHLEYQPKIGDIYLHIFGASRGGAYVINQEFSVYRVNHNGSWNSLRLLNKAEQIKQLADRVKAFKVLAAQYFYDYRRDFYVGVVFAILKSGFHVDEFDGETQFTIRTMMKKISWLSKVNLSAYYIGRNLKKMVTRIIRKGVEAQAS